MYSVDNDFFSEINNKKKAYWLGFIYADGHVAQKAPWFVIVQIKDYDHIKKMCDDIQFNGPIKLPAMSGGFSGSTQQYRVSICKKLLCNQLNIHGRNNTVMTIPAISQDLISHFIRGYFDGDGSIYFTKTSTVNKYGIKYFYKNLKCQIIASQSFALEMKNLFLSLGITSTISNSKTSYMYYVTISGGKNLRLLHNYLYSDSDTFLLRKKEIFDQVFSPRGAKSLR